MLVVVVVVVVFLGDGVDGGDFADASVVVRLVAGVGFLEALNISINGVVEADLGVVEGVVVAAVESYFLGGEASVPITAVECMV